MSNRPGYACVPGAFHLWDWSCSPFPHAVDEARRGARRRAPRSSRCDISTVTIQVLLFASYADAFGSSRIDVDLPATATVRDVVDAVRTRAGAIALPPHPLVAVNQSYAPYDQSVRSTDEVALIPPVAGG